MEDLTKLKIEKTGEKEYFMSEDFKSLVRSMNLYGARYHKLINYTNILLGETCLFLPPYFVHSLRKGEVPDEISRSAEELTNSFSSECMKVTSSQNFDICEVAFNKYLSFAKLPSLGSDDWKK